MRTRELLDSIRNYDMVMPEFQREYVWNKEQAKQLMVSLVKGYPVGGLLLWKTDTPPELKNVQKLPDKLGTVQVILDGQQRLTTLYMLLTGEIPPYYTADDILNDPRDLYYNLETGELLYYQASRMRDNPRWRQVVSCNTDNSINVFEIAQRFANDPNEAFSLAQQYNARLNELRTIKDALMPVQTVPPNASLEDAIDIFDRVNSQGTKLTDAELALTHITGKWPTARRVIKDKLDELSRRHFHFNLTFMTRALTAVVTRRALFETVHSRPRDELQTGWQQLAKILDYLANILPQRAFIHSTDDLSTTNALIPLIVYLAINGGKFPSERSLKNAVHWLYAALMWARYTAQTDQRLEQDIMIVVREEVPWDKLREQIIDQRGRIEVKASDFEGRGVQHPLFRASHIIAKAHGAVDWFNGVPLGTPHGKSYRLHSHHIFPIGLLRKNGYDTEGNHLHRTVINEIANRAFLTAESNMSLSDTPPETYLPNVEAQYPGALAHQFVPVNPELWRVERFTRFLEARRELMAQKVNDFMRSLIIEPQVTQERPIGDLIALGESAALEFKSTLQWDVVQNQPNRALHHSVLKTIAAFLNTDGGVLIIGVEDQGAIYGLEQDLKLLGNSLDRFEQKLNSLISDAIGAEYARLIKLRFEVADAKHVCVVNVDKAPESVFVKSDKGNERAFYIRVGNTTRSLNPEETMRYVNMERA